MLLSKRSSSNVSSACHNQRNKSQDGLTCSDYKLALLLHPDSSHPSSSPDHFATLNKAYNLLSKQSSRSAFLKTGYGWDVSTSSGGTQTWSDSLMRAEIARRRNGGAAAWSGASRRYRDSDAGRGAWGGFDGSQGWRPYEDPSKGFSPPTSGPAEERYMSNPRFLAVVGVAVRFSYYVVASKADRFLECCHSVGALA